MLARTLLGLVVLVLAAAAAPAQEIKPPKIEFQSPAADERTAESRIQIEATVSDERGIRSVRLSVNGERVALDAAPSPSAPPQTFRIRVQVPLTVGENVIGISATSMAARITQAARTVVRTPPATAGPAPAKTTQRYAVIIGVGAYEHAGMPALRFAERDAQALFELLTTKGGYAKENVALLTDATPNKPTLQNVVAALGNLRRATKDDAVLIYYSGRGAREADTTGRERDAIARYLTARDTEPDALFSTALRLNEFEERIVPRIRAGRLVMLFDTDYTGNVAGRSFSKQTTRAMPSAAFLERLARASGRVLINASSGNESALDAPDFQHGLFSYFLLQGLAGAADRDGDGFVTVTELYTFVQGRVGEHARKAGTRQTPLLDVGGAMSDLPLVEVPKK